MENFFLTVVKTDQVLSCLIYSQSYSMQSAVSEAICDCTEMQRAEIAYLK